MTTPTVRMPGGGACGGRGREGRGGWQGQGAAARPDWGARMAAGADERAGSALPRQSSCGGSPQPPGPACRAPASLAMRAATGAQPVPVPPPMPAVMNTRSAPSTCWVWAAAVVGVAELAVAQVGVVEGRGGAGCSPRAGAAAAWPALQPEHRSQPQLQHRSQPQPRHCSQPQPRHCSQPQPQPQQQQPRQPPQPPRQRPTILRSASSLSSAAWRPSSGLPPQPRPRVTCAAAAGRRRWRMQWHGAPRCCSSSFCRRPPRRRSAACWATGGAPAPARRC